MVPQADVLDVSAVRLLRWMKAIMMDSSWLSTLLWVYSQIRFDHWTNSSLESVWSHLRSPRIKLDLKSFGFIRAITLACCHLMS